MFEVNRNHLVTAAASALLAAGLSAPALGSEIEFGYECKDCAVAWPDVDTGARENNCAGPNQSPIALSFGDGRRRKLPGLRTDYGRSVVLTEERLLTNVEWFDASGTNSIHLGNKTYRFLQFHFHSTAEHVVNGERSPVEMHFVNQASDGSLAVLAVFIEQGRYNRNFEPIIDSISNGHEEDMITVDLDDLTPNQLRSFRYVGSTTTPPCVADVQWLLIKQPIELSEGQIGIIKGEIRHLNHGFDNNRSIQNRERRRIVTDSYRLGDDDDGDDD